MTALVLVLGTIVAQPSVELATVGGETVSGKLEKITAAEITLDGKNDRRAVPLDSILSVKFSSAEELPASAESATTLQFQGGGRLSCRRVVMRERRIIAQPRLGEAINVPLSVVAAVRFRKLEPTITDDWEEILENTPTRDLLVVRNGQSLDRLEGTISGLDEETLTFLVEETRVAIDRTKPRLFAVVAAHSPDAEGESVGVVRLRNGDWLSVSSLSYDGETLSVTTAGGWKTSFPAEAISELDFGRGRVRYLSDIEPRKSEHESFLGTELDTVFDVRRDRGDASPEEPIRIAGQAFRKGLVIHSRTELTYRLNGDYQRFVAIAGIEDLVRPLGSVELTISLDGATALQKTITGSQPPIPIDLKVDGADDLTIVVDFADDWGTGDHLALGGARLIK